MSDAIRDEVMPEGAWKFDAEVTGVFDDMLARSIPQYEEMRRLTFAVGSSFCWPGHAVLDIGCSRGAALEPFVLASKGRAAMQQFRGVEVSPPMVEAARRRLREAALRADLDPDRAVEVVEGDLRTYRLSEGVQPSLILAVLTLQFVPIEYRQTIVRRAYHALPPGGALILVEKVLGDSAELDGLLVEKYLEMKRVHGYSVDQIVRKRSALEGVLVPITARWNEDMLNRAGFRSVDCFWRWLNFAGWVAVKE